MAMELKDYAEEVIEHPSHPRIWLLMPRDQHCPFRVFQSVYPIIGISDVKPLRTTGWEVGSTPHSNLKVRVWKHQHKVGERTSKRICFSLGSLIFKKWRHKSKKSSTPKNFFEPNIPKISKQNLYYTWISTMTRNPTLPETNIAPENGWLEDVFPFGKAYFQVLCYFQGV